MEKHEQPKRLLVILAILSSIYLLNDLLFMRAAALWGPPDGGDDQGRVGGAVPAMIVHSITDLVSLGGSLP